MNKILVIDDQEYKLNDILNQLDCKYVNFDSAMNLYSSKKKICTNIYDLILLDMTIKNYVTRNEFFGIDILTYVELLGIATPVIVVTQFYNYNDFSLCDGLNGFYKINDYYKKEPEYNFSISTNIHKLPEMHMYLSQNFKNYYGCVLYMQNDTTWVDNLKKMLYKLGGPTYENFIIRR